MARIKQLLPQEAQKIAAGEVVERPANVVKELVENALDAGATQITISIEDAGKKLIQVIDNGCGMDPEDARMCIKHHATSKIAQVSDLEHIVTFGFRGEALSSISSVSKVVLTTKEADSTAGVTLEVSDGIITKEIVVACNTGTEIAIHDLFYNVPARKKFLKSKETEWRTILQLFYAFCLDYPQVHFKLYNEKKLVHNCPAASHLTLRIEQLYEKALSHNILVFEAEETRMNLKVSGALSDPQYSRYDRNQIFVFVNKRWVKNHKLAQALIKGYQGMLQPERYPAGFIFISLDPEFVDINIHPRKEEVQFLHPRIVELCIENGVKERLELYTAQRLGAPVGPKTTAPEQSVQQQKTNPFLAQLVQTNSYPTEQVWHISKQFEQNLPAYPEENQQSENAQFEQILTRHFTQPETLTTKQSLANQAPQANTSTSAQLIEQTQQVTTSQELVYTLVGQALNTYIIIQTGDGLVVIDQHAAHERIIYERLKANFNTIERAKLLFPQVLSIAKNDMITLEPYLALFDSFGLLIEQASETELVIQETPIYLKNQPITDIIQQAIGWIHELHNVDTDQLRKSLQEKIHAQMSCKAAVKAGDELTPAGMHQIIKDLYAQENRLTCPHGRPTIWALSHYEIEKKFKRNYK